MLHSRYSRRPRYCPSRAQHALGHSLKNLVCFHVSDLTSRQTLFPVFPVQKKRASWCVRSEMSKQTKFCKEYLKACGTFQGQKRGRREYRELPQYTYCTRKSFQATYCTFYRRDRAMQLNLFYRRQSFYRSTQTLLGRRHQKMKSGVFRKARTLCLRRLKGNVAKSTLIKSLNIPLKRGLRLLLPDTEDGLVVTSEESYAIRSQEAVHKTFIAKDANPKKVEIEGHQIVRQSGVAT